MRKVENVSDMRYCQTCDAELDRITPEALDLTRNLFCRPCPTCANTNVFEVLEGPGNAFERMHAYDSLR